MSDGKLISPALVYLRGDEMTRYIMGKLMELWVDPYVDIGAWEFYDLSAMSRDKTQDKVLKDALEAGKRIGAIFKDATITPSVEQAKEMQLTKAWGSPNKVLREQWNGISISRDTIGIEGIPTGYKKPVLFDRYPLGDLYDSKYQVSDQPGRMKVEFIPEDGSAPKLIDDRKVNAKEAMVCFSTPLEPLKRFARHFLGRALAARVPAYLVTKKTAFKYQEALWEAVKTTFDEEYAEPFATAGIQPITNILTDAATIYLNNWRDGGYAFAAPNYEGDTLTDQLGAVHGSPALVTSVLSGYSSETGKVIKEFEAIHGTGHTDWMDHKAGKPTSFNPMGLAYALWGALDHAAFLEGPERQAEVREFTDLARKAAEKTMQSGKATKDIIALTKSDAKPLTTEEFINAVADEMGDMMMKRHAAKKAS